ncbi:MAG: hypothetical protein ACHQ51_04910 [Elusimicrobiota bacterium]
MRLFPILALFPLALSAFALAAPPPAPVPFVHVVLDAAAFRGANPLATCANAGAFVSRLGRRMTMCQDNDARMFVKVRARFEEESGPLAAIRRSFARLRFEKTLRDAGLGEVSETTKEGTWEILLKPAAYESSVRRALASASAPFELEFYRNKAMAGSIWIRFAVDGLPDAKSYAADLPRRYPAVREAGVFVEVPTFEARIGAGAPR